MYRPLAKAILAVSIVVTTAVSIFISCSSAAAAQQIKVFLSGRQVEFDVPPIVDKGGILVPARAIFEALGATVDWDPDRETVSAYKDGIVVRLLYHLPE